MPHDTLDAALAELRAHLVRGDYHALPDLAQRIEAQIASLPRQDIARLRDRAQQTAACVDAARAGLRAARMQIQGRAASALGTYDSRGTRSPLAALAHALRRV